MLQVYLIFSGDLVDRSVAWRRMLDLKTACSIEATYMLSSKASFIG